MALTFPVSGYLWATGVIMTGILYMVGPRANPANIPMVPDFLWGVLLTLIGSGMLWAMLREHSRWIKIMSLLIATFAMTLFLASVIDSRPVSAISSGLTCIYYGYTYLCSDLIPEWRAIKQERLRVLYKDLDL